MLAEQTVTPRRCRNDSALTCAEHRESLDQRTEPGARRQWRSERSRPLPRGVVKVGDNLLVLGDALGVDHFSARSKRPCAPAKRQRRRHRTTASIAPGRRGWAVDAPTGGTDGPVGDAQKAPSWWVGRAAISRDNAGESRVTTSSASSTAGSVVSALLRPPPGARTRPSGSGSPPASDSATPRRTGPPTRLPQNRDEHDRVDQSLRDTGTDILRKMRGTRTGDPSGPATWPPSPR